jgi:hypothetical protein
MRTLSTSLAAALLVAAPAVAAAPRIDLPEPDGPEPRVIEEGADSPLHYRLPDDIVSYWGRLMLGVQMLLPQSEIERSDVEARFALDVLPGMEIGFGRRSSAMVVIEGGYGFTYDATHWFVAGAGLGLRRLEEDENGLSSGHLALALIPHGLVGTVDGDLAYGVRTSLVATYWLVSAEVGHQWVSLPGGFDSQEVRILLGYGGSGSTL